MIDAPDTTMTLEELFNYVVGYVSRSIPDDEKHNKRLAILIFTVFAEYVLDHWQDQEDVNSAWVDVEDLYFSGYASKQLDFLGGK